MLKKDKLVKLISDSLVVLPSPSNISYFWNFGSILGLCLVIQIITGIFLAMHYASDLTLAFSSVDHIMRNVSGGWIMRIIHANGASMFFAGLYTHLGRGIYYGSFNLTHTWMVGSSIFILTMATAFLGYVLPWGQMSFWGATVITNLFSAIPYAGQDIVYWLWGGFAVSKPTLSRFFSLHFLLPFMIAALTMVHLLYLHQSGSSNPLGVHSNTDKIQFHPYFSTKDLLGYSVFAFIFMFVCLIEPWALGDPENFINANPLVTPIHIQPEWYFLFAYAILRSIPNKLGGVLALFASVLILYFFPLAQKIILSSSAFSSWKKFLFWTLVATWAILTWIGARPVEAPYEQVGQVFTVLYFIIMMMFLS